MPEEQRKKRSVYSVHEFWRQRHGEQEKYCRVIVWDDGTAEIMEQTRAEKEESDLFDSMAT